MPDTTLHIPPDWERKSQVTKLRIRLGQNGNSQFAELSPLYYLRMWSEWASNPDEWRPLNARVAELSGHNWDGEDMTHIIEQACGWKGRVGMLLRSAIEAGVYEIESRGEISGLSMEGWAKLNAHLLPGYESMQEKGGKATRMTTARKLAMRMAAQQQQIFDAQGTLLLTAQTQSADEGKLALALVIQIDRHCGLSVRITQQYSEALLRDAVSVIRRHPQPMIDRVLSYISDNRSNPAVVKIPETVLEKFDDYLVAATKSE